MTVAHILLNGASHYDRTCESVDRLAPEGQIQASFALGPGGAVTKGSVTTLGELARALATGGFALLHIHGSTKVPGQLLSGLRIPWLADRHLPLPRSLFRRIPPAATVLLDRDIPEAVSEDYFVESPAKTTSSTRSRIGTFVRSDATRNNVEQASARIQRFREDVEWNVFDSPPSPGELSSLDLWVDPAPDDEDMDGMVGEAIACRTPVVASRTIPNSSRLDQGRAGILAPPNDHNELVHAVLNALFKDELATPCRHHAETIRNRFRPHVRREALQAIYEELTR